MASTTINQAKTAILDLLLSAWGTRTPVTLENEVFDPEVEGGTEWIRGSIRNLASNQETLGNVGNREYKRAGSLFVQIFTPSDAGTADADGHAELVRTTFEGISLAAGGSGSIKFFDAEVREIPGDGRWFQTNVEVAFDYYQQR